MTGVLCALAGSGSAPVLDTQTVTVSVFNPSGFGLAYGFVTGIGSIADGTFNPKGGATITALYCDTAFGANAVVFSLGSSQTNDGWSTMTVSGVTYNRADASYTPGSPTSWAWNSATNPFGTTVGATVAATFV